MGICRASELGIMPQVIDPLWPVVRPIHRSGDLLWVFLLTVFVIFATAVV